VAGHGRDQPADDDGRCGDAVRTRRARLIWLV
jgi:hypothetical protein